MSLGHGASIVRSGLILHLDAANVKSYPGTGTTWSDLSSGGRNATLTNGPTYDSGAIVYDGVDDSASVNLAGLGSLSGLTLNIWHYSNVEASKSLINSGPFILHFRGAGFYLRSAAPATNSGYLGWQTAPSGMRWNMLTGTWDGTTMKLYTNGVKQNNELSYSAGSSGVLEALGNTTIGGYFNVSQTWTDGKISMCSIYNRALTAAEVSQNFEALRGRYGI